MFTMSGCACLSRRIYYFGANIVTSGKNESHSYDFDIWAYRKCVDSLNYSPKNLKLVVAKHFYLRQEIDN